MKTVLLILGMFVSTAAFAAPLQAQAAKGVAKAWNVKGVNYQFDKFRATGKGVTKTFTGTLSFTNGTVVRGKINAKSGKVTNLVTIAEGTEEGNGE